MTEEDCIIVTIRMADGSRKDQIPVYADETAGSVVGEARNEWKLDPKVDYQLLNTRTNTVFASSDFMTTDLVQQGDILDLQPVFTAAF